MLCNRHKKGRSAPRVIKVRYIEHAMSNLCNPAPTYDVHCGLWNVG